MTILELKNHQVWRDLTEILENLDANILVQEHLNQCDYQVCGYWDEQDEYYETIIAFPSLVRYKNPTPNPLPASEEGAMMYLV